MKFKFWPNTKVMRFSLIAFVLTIITSIISMGFLGVGLYFIAAPVLAILFSNLPKDINAWHGDWVWPAMLGMPIVWACSFIIAGFVYLYLEKLDWTKLTLKTSYIVILLMWNALIWLLLLLSVQPQIS